MFSRGSHFLFIWMCLECFLYWNMNSFLPKTGSVHNFIHFWGKIPIATEWKEPQTMTLPPTCFSEHVVVVIVFLRAICAKCFWSCGPKVKHIQDFDVVFLVEYCTCQKCLYLFLWIFFFYPCPEPFFKTMRLLYSFGSYDFSWSFVMYGKLYLDSWTGDSLVTT